MTAAAAIDIRLDELWAAVKVKLASAAMNTALQGSGRIYIEGEDYSKPEGAESAPWGRLVIVPSQTLWGDVDEMHEPQNVSFLVRAEFNNFGPSATRPLEAAQAEVYGLLQRWLPPAGVYVRAVMPFYRFRRPQPNPLWDETRGVVFTSSEWRTEVVAGLALPLVAVASVVVTPATIVSGTGLATATPKDANGNTLTGRAVQWDSTNTGIITVDSSGNYTVVGAGTAYLVATIEGQSGVIVVDTSAGSFPITGAGSATLPPLTASGAGVVADAFALRHTFTGADDPTTTGTADTGQTPTVFSGTAGRIGNKMYFVSPSGEAALAWNSTKYDGPFRANITLSSVRALVALMFRGIDGNNWLLAQLHISSGPTSNEIILAKKDAGAGSNLAVVTSAGLVLGTTYLLEVIAAGADLTIKLDGVTKIAHTLSGADQTKYGTATLVGFRIYSDAQYEDGGSRADNLEVPA